MSQSSFTKCERLLKNVENTYKALTGRNFDFLRNANIVLSDMIEFNYGISMLNFFFIA